MYTNADVFSSNKRLLATFMIEILSCHPIIQSVNPCAYTAYCVCVFFLSVHGVGKEWKEKWVFGFKAEQKIEKKKRKKITYTHIQTNLRSRSKRINVDSVWTEKKSSFFCCYTIVCVVLDLRIRIDVN